MVKVYQSSFKVPGLVHLKEGLVHLKLEVVGEKVRPIVHLELQKVVGEVRPKGTEGFATVRVRFDFSESEGFLESFQDECHGYVLIPAVKIIVGELKIYEEKDFASENYE
ncbi:hypothetical protein M8J77_022632 [Diaphorina citri]|nr:hypothetical protein M8J77_022632 [Diaphorina citri]